MSDSWLDRLNTLRQSMPDADESTPDNDICENADTTASETARLDIILERKGRAGKCATIICGFTIDDDSIDAIASELKRKLGVGGSARGGEILIQGDRRHDVLKFLSSKGFKARII